VLDLSVFDRLCQAMSAKALAEVVCTFVEDTQMRIDLMRNADRDDLRRQAHTIKGGASMVGAAQVSAAASAIEGDIDDSGDRRQKLDELESYLRRAEVILKGRLKI
jgi:HPt (histidine-containing phosphotransfer) domain-containing protein